MATVKGKPRGYFDYILALDCETTGISYNSVDPSYDSATGKRYQAISFGFVVADANTLEPIEDLYIEIQWDGISEWSEGAEKIHGLTREHLRKNGLTSEEAATAIGNLILKYWGGDTSIRTLGHNVATFDLWFLRQLMSSNGIDLKFGNRHVDTSSIGFVNWGVYNSDDLFELVGFEARGDHNALDDAYMSLKAASVTRTLFKTHILGE